MKKDLIDSFVLLMLRAEVECKIESINYEEFKRILDNKTILKLLPEILWTKKKIQEGDPCLSVNFGEHDIGKETDMLRKKLIELQNIEEHKNG